MVMFLFLKEIDNMKKIIFILGIIILCLLIPHKNEEVRIRIISNSNDQIDINNKYIVREAIVRIFKNYVFENPDEFISNNMDIIIKDLKKELPNDIFYLLKISYKEVYFPPKSKNNSFVTPGKYKTLLIEIGEANGSNWWSVLYPEFFNVEYSDFKEVEFKWFFFE
jgi:stage II sporulation protein R